VLWNPSYPNNDVSIAAKNYQLQNFQALYFNNINNVSSSIIVTTAVSQDTSVINV